MTRTALTSFLSSFPWSWGSNPGFLDPRSTTEPQPKYVCIHITEDGLLLPFYNTLILKNSIGNLRLSLFSGPHTCRCISLCPLPSVLCRQVISHCPLPSPLRYTDGHSRPSHSSLCLSSSPWRCLDVGMGHSTS